MNAVEAGDADLEAESIDSLGPDAFRKPKGVGTLARTVLDVFFRHVEVSGLHHVPEQGAVVFVGNHVNGLLDPAILMAYLPRVPRFLGKSTLWQMAALRPFLFLAAAIPVYRRQDPGVDVRRNSETFDRCHQVLAAAGTIALFPEGKSHNEPSLAELKTGVARIVLDALRRYPEANISIVPVGLTFDNKTQFRSRLLVKVGPPIDPGTPLAGELVEEARRQARELTQVVRSGLEEVTLNYPSWHEAELIQRAAAIYSRPSLEGPTEQALEHSFEVRKAFIDGYGELLRTRPDQVHRVAEDVADYDRCLDALGLRDEQVAASYRGSLVTRFVLKSLWLLLAWLPLGLVGMVTHVLPFQGVAWAAKRLAETPDTVSTYKVFPALLLYPFTWILWAVLAGSLWGWPAGGLTFALMPLCGYGALRWVQRLDLLIERSRAFFLMRHGGAGTAEPAEQRRRILKQVSSLAEVLRGLKPDLGPSELGESQ